MKKRQIDEEAIFSAALEYESQSERMSYVQVACGSNQDLFDRVQALLEATNVQNDFLDDPESDLEAISEAIPLQAGQQAVGNQRHVLVQFQVALRAGGGERLIVCPHRNRGLPHRLGDHGIHLARHE